MKIVSNVDLMESETIKIFYITNCIMTNNMEQVLSKGGGNGTLLWLSIVLETRDMSQMG